MAQERDVPVEVPLPDAAEEVVPGTVWGQAGWNRPVHPGPRHGPVADVVSVAAVRKVAEELTARAVRLHQDALRERDRATTLLRRSGSATDGSVDTPRQSTRCSSVALLGSPAEGRAREDVERQGRVVDHAGDALDQAGPADLAAVGHAEALHDRS